LLERFGPDSTISAVIVGIVDHLSLNFAVYSAKSEWMAYQMREDDPCRPAKNDKKGNPSDAVHA
jgi:hypothetical protein